MNNKVALITGGATGIGKATALILASRGVKVVISGRRESLGQKLAEEIRANGGEAAFIPEYRRRLPGEVGKRHSGAAEKQRHGIELRKGDTNEWI